MQMHFNPLRTVIDIYCKSDADKLVYILNRDSERIPRSLLQGNLQF
jgi:hypothetical protein